MRPYFVFFLFEDFDFFWVNDFWDAVRLDLVLFLEPLGLPRLTGAFDPVGVLRTGDDTVPVDFSVCVVDFPINNDNQKEGKNHFIFTFINTPRYLVKPFVFSYERKPPIPNIPPRTVRRVPISNSGKSGRSTPEAVKTKTNKG
tara:strand:- start:77 stop:505 length:429 start_codon:yes stop_codon:yes gene_type:complete